MATPQFILDLRAKIGHDPLWIPGCTAIVVRPHRLVTQKTADAAGETPGVDGPAHSAEGDTAGPDTDRHPDTAAWQAALQGPLDPATVEILVVRRADNGWWTPVTGIVDPGEEAAAAAVREVWEEAGVRTRPIRLLSTEVVGPMTYANGDHATYLDLAFLLAWEGGEPWPADGENSQATFVRADQLPPMNDRFRRIVAAALSGRRDAAFGW